MIDIYVSTHKKVELNLPNYCHLIQAGSAVHDKIEGYLHDCGGDTDISRKNESYCELTALYWLWKHSNADIKGLFHYRRMFYAGTSMKCNRRIIEKKAKSIAKYIITEEQIEEYLREYDVIDEIPYCPGTRGTAKEDLLKYCYAEDVEMLKQVMQNDFPEYYDTFIDVLQSRHLSYCNMMITRSSVLDSYCKWLFIGIVFVLLAEDKVTARILGLALVELIGYSWCFIIQMHRGKKFYSKEFWKYALLFNLPLIPHYLSMTVLSSSDRIMIKSLVGESEAGIYSLAYSISQIMTLFNTALMQTIEPWLYKKIKVKQIDDIKKVAYPAFFLIAVVNLILIAVAPELVAIFAPASYYEAIWVMPPVAMSVYFMFSYTFFAVFEFYYEKTSYTTIATTSGAVLNIALNYIFINMFGYMAAGYTTLICYMFFAIFHYFCMRKICRKEFNNRMPYSTRILLGITIAFMLMGFLFMVTYNYTLIRYALVLAIAVLLVIFRKKVVEIIRQMFSLKKQD